MLRENEERTEKKEEESATACRRVLPLKKDERETNEKRASRECNTPPSLVLRRKSGGIRGCSGIGPATRAALFIKDLGTLPRRTAPHNEAALHWASVIPAAVFCLPEK